MAYIALESRTSSSITVYIKGLDPNYTESNLRMAWYYIKESSEDEYPREASYWHSIPAGCSSTDISGLGAYTFRYLNPSTKYDIKIEITNIADYGDVILERSIWTKDPIPDITHFSVSRSSYEDTGVFLATCTFEVDDVSKGSTTYEIYARQSGTDTWYLKSGDDILYREIDETFGGGTVGIAKGYINIKCYNEDDDISKRYDFKLVVTINDEQDTRIIRDVALIRNVILELVGYSEQQASGYDIGYKIVVDESISKYAKFMVSLYDTQYNLIGSHGPYHLESVFGGSNEQSDMCAFGVNNEGIYIIEAWITQYNSEEDYNNDNIYIEDFMSCEVEVKSEPPVIEYFEAEGTDGRGIYMSSWVTNIMSGYSTYKIYISTDSVNWDKEISGTFDETGGFVHEIVVDSGGLYYIKLVATTSSVSSEVITECFASEAEKPNQFAWSRIYVNSEDEDGDKITLCSKAYIPSSNGGIQPITANNWNAIRKRVNDMRLYLGISKYEFGDNVSPGGDFTPSMYNDVRTAIQEMGSGAGSLIPEVTKTTEINARLFEVLRDELNAAIRNL